MKPPMLTRFKKALEALFNSEHEKPLPAAIPSLKLKEKPPLESLINTYDFEQVANETLTAKTWAFYSSAATDLITRDANKSTFDRLSFRPRILRNVRDVSTRTTILGSEVDVPFFVSPAALAKLIHPEGEKAISRGCVQRGVAQCISANASYTISEITSAVSSPGHPFWFQLYVNKDRQKTEILLKQVEAAGCSAIFVTVDAPVIGKREADERTALDDESVKSGASGYAAKKDQKGGGIGRTTGAYIDSSLNWEDLEWLRRSTKLKLVLKGIQSAADAKLAVQHGVDGIMISNHGGRSLDTAPATILVLIELRKLCPEVFSKVEVLVDSGVRRGTDILKCICLGAKGVGLGRPFLYALNYGQDGIEHYIEILKDELVTSMQMIGITHLSQAHTGLVNFLDVQHLIPADFGELEQQIKARL